MAIIKFGLIILTIAVIITISVRFFWVASILILYRSLGSIITFEFMEDKFDASHMVYFIIIMSLTIAVHFALMSLTGGYTFMKYVIYIILFIWILYYYEPQELLFLTDWAKEVDFEFSVDWFKEQFVMMVETSPEEYAEFFINIFNNTADVIKSVFNSVFGFLLE